MNERRDVKVAQWLAAVQPLQLVLGGLFAFTLNAGFDALDRPAMAVAFFALALACGAAIPLEAWLIRLAAPSVSGAAAAARTARLQHAALITFVVGATLTVVAGNEDAWMLVLWLACALVVVRIVGELWAIAIHRREANQR
jgi:hypothetical protein